MSKSQNFWRLLSFLKPFFWRMALSVLLSVLTILSSVGLMMTSAWMISTAGLHPGIEALGVAPTGVRFFGIGRAVFRYLERLVSHDATFRLLAELRVWFYQEIEPLAPAKLSQYRSGDLMARVVSDVEELQNFFIRVVAPPMTAIVVAVFMTLFFLAFDVWAALVLIIFMLITGLILPYFAWWRSQEMGRELVNQRARLHATMVDSIQGLADSIAYGYSDTLLAEVQEINNILSVQENKMTTLDGLQTGLSVLLVNLAAFAVLVTAIPHVDAAYLATLVLGTIAAFEAFMPLTLAAQHLNSELASAQRLFEVADMSGIEETENGAIIPSDKTLKIENLGFRYASDLAPVLNNFSLTVKQGEKIAILGESGAGKSSLVNILLRFWDYDAGQITIGDTDLRDLSFSDVRDIFAVMTQRTHLFNTTILENIRIARKSASDEEVIQAAKQAQVDDFIRMLPDAYKTFVGENGVLLSAGERQRIALARVLLKNAPIWILDEATANLDAQTEISVMESVMNTAENHTLLIITHRLPLIQNVDRTISLVPYKSNEIQAI